MQPAILFIKNLYYNTKIRYLFVGGMNTALGYAIYFSLAYFCNVYYIVANTIGFVIALVNSYFWNKYFVFQKSGHSLSEVVKFLSVYAVQYAFGIMFLFVCVDMFGVNQYVAGFLGIVFAISISYAGNKYMTFRK